MSGGGGGGQGVYANFVTCLLSIRVKWPVHSDRQEAIYTAVLNVFTPSELLAIFVCYFQMNKYYVPLVLDFARDFVFAIYVS